VRERKKERERERERERRNVGEHAMGDSQETTALMIVGDGALRELHDVCWRGVRNRGELCARAGLSCLSLRGN